MTSAARLPTVLMMLLSFKVNTLSTRTQLARGRVARVSARLSIAKACPWVGTDVTAKATKSPYLSGTVNTKTGRFLADLRSEYGKG